MSTSPQDIVKVVDPIAARYGVPTLIWETVAEVESGLNPRAVGDNGSSFGLFQLHRGGQLGNLTQEQAFDPATNAEQAMPAIAAAWRALNKSIGTPTLVNGQQDPGTSNWWFSFASLSGHPGGADSTTQAEATRLQQEMSALAIHPISATTNTNVPTRQPYLPGSAPTCNALNPFSYGDCVNQYIQTNYISPIQNSAAKIGIFIIALLLIIAGLWAISGR